MEVSKVYLEWTNLCCGCTSKVAAGEATYILTNAIGIRGSIHLCSDCIKKIITCYKEE